MGGDGGWGVPLLIDEASARRRDARQSDSDPDGKQLCAAIIIISVSTNLSWKKNDSNNSV